MKYEFQLLDFCYPDYFRGHHLPVIAVPVYGQMTYKEVKQAISENLNAYFDLYEEYNEGHINQAFEAWPETNELYFNPDAFADYDESADDDGLYLYFVLGRIERDKVMPSLKYAVYP